MEFYVFESESTNQDGQPDREGNLDQHREGRLMARHEARAGRGGADSLRHARQVRAAPLRGRVGDFNPIHIDPEFAKAVGLPEQHPARPLLDGAGGARRHGRPPGRPPLAEAAVGAVPRHGPPGGGDPRHRHRARGRRRRAIIDMVAEQEGNQIIRNAEAELEL